MCNVGFPTLCGVAQNEYSYTRTTQELANETFSSAGQAPRGQQRRAPGWETPRAGHPLAGGGGSGNVIWRGGF